MDTEIIDGSVLVSCSYHNKFPQTEWLKTSEMYFLMALEARIPNQANSRTVVPSRGIMGESLLASSSFCWFLDRLGDH